MELQILQEKYSNTLENMHSVLSQDLHIKDIIKLWIPNDNNFYLFCIVEITPLSIIMKECIPFTLNSQYPAFKVYNDANLETKRIRRSRYKKKDGFLFENLFLKVDKNILIVHF